MLSNCASVLTNMNYMAFKKELRYSNSNCCSSPVINFMTSMQMIENVSRSKASKLNVDCREARRIDDLLDLRNKSEAKVSDFMRARYLCKAYCTWAGQVLLSVHPYEDSKNYEQVTDNSIPSVGAVVDRAWNRIRYNLNRNNQTIVISGESGAGKTHSACLAIKHLAQREHADAQVENVLRKAWASVPLLTAFGNAATAHNANSSRFGKLLQFQYSGGRICGAYVQIYLLEKTRVVGPNEGESNFLIFRQILEGFDQETLSCIFLKKYEKYRIAPNVRSKSAHSETFKALETLDINELHRILSVLAFILNMGNVEFESVNDTYQVTRGTLEFLKNSANLLGVEADELEDVLCNVTFSTKSITRRCTMYKSSCGRKEECEERRNCIMKLLYNNLFDWLVNCINASIFQDGDRLLGLLDIYGFEVFEHNTFEQLCINYANERLQLYFMDRFLIERRNETVELGLEVDPIDNSDYVKRVNLLDGSISVFEIFNEECVVKRYNSDCFVSTRLTETLRGKEHFIGSTNNVNTTFCIKHYAGVVKYDTRSMLQKNRDKVPDDVLEFLKKCNVEFIRSTLIYHEESSGNTTLWKFKRSLDTLMQIFENSNVSYVKCLKPNPYKIAEFIDEDFFAQQLVSNGVFEILKLPLQKYPIRLNFQNFAEEFGCEAYNLLSKVFKEDIYTRKESIFLSDRVYKAFKALQRLKLSISARKIQKCWNIYNAKRRKAAMVIQKCFRNSKRFSNCLQYDAFIDLSKKSSDLCIGDCEHAAPAMSRANKIEYFLENNRFDINFEGDRLSLTLEKVYNELITKPFKRVLFCGDRIVSYNKLAEVPVRLHTSKTCIRYSSRLPKSEMPSGLSDIF